MVHGSKPSKAGNGFITIKMDIIRQHIHTRKIRLQLKWLALKGITAQLLISFQYLKDTFDLMSQDFYRYLNIFIYRYV